MSSAFAVRKELTNTSMPKFSTLLKGGNFVNDTEDGRAVALTITVGFGDIGREVTDDLGVFYKVLPHELQCAWRIIQVDSEETIENLKAIDDEILQARSTILQKQNIAYILDKGYEVEGRDRNSEIRICNVYVWGSDDFGSKIPIYILEYIKKKPNEMHAGFCFETSEGDVNLKELEVPQSFAYYLIQDTLHTGAQVQKDEVVSSISGTILTGFMPNNKFDIAKNRGSVSTIGFSGKYGFIWSSKSIITRMICDKLVKHQISKSYKDIEREGLSSEFKSIVRAVNPQEIGLQLFSSKSAGILEKFRIPAIPKWNSNTFDIDMDNETISRELHDFKKSDWPNQIRVYASAFKMSLAWKWRMILKKAGMRLGIESLRDFLPAMREILDNTVHAPAYVEYLISSISSNCDQERKALSSRKSSLESALGTLKKKLMVQLDPYSYLLRTLLWILPIVIMLSTSIYMAYTPDETAKGLVIGLLTGIITLGVAYFHFYRKLQASEENIVTARDDAISEMKIIESCHLSQNSIREMEILTSKIRSLVSKSDEDLSKYKLNLMEFVKLNNSKFQHIEEGKYAVLSPILESIDEYKHILNKIIKVDTDLLIFNLLKNTSIMEGLYRDTWKLDLFEKAVYDFCLNEIDLCVTIKHIPTIKDLLQIKSEVNNSNKDHTLDKLLRDLINFTVPMTSRDNIGSEELIIGTPNDLIKNVKNQIKEHSISGEPTVLDMGEYPLLFCINRVIIQTERGDL